MEYAALTCQGSLVGGLSDGFQYAFVAGAVTCGLTIIEDALNPASLAILHSHFPDETVQQIHLLFAAVPPR